MKIRYWGVRGSIAVPGKETIEYGGNTSCVSVEADGKTLIFDAGTGIRLCGNYLLSRGGRIEASVFISHTHWDHIQGFPFFVPSYIPGNRFTLHGPPSDIQNLSLKQIMEMQTNYEYFPVRISQLGSTMDYVDCGEETLEAEGFEIRTCKLNHPVACLAYKLVYDGRCFIYGGDHEPYRNLYRDSDDEEDVDEGYMKELDRKANEQNRKIVEFCRGADVVSWDAQYDEREYQSKKGWGHSTYRANLALAEKAGLSHMIFTHHDPAQTDESLSQREADVKKAAAGKNVRVEFAREGMEIDL